MRTGLPAKYNRINGMVFGTSIYFVLQELQNQGFQDLFGPIFGYTNNQTKTVVSYPFQILNLTRFKINSIFG
jgi:hypothetical protein